ncbi:nitroreductase family protein [Pseudomonas baetica]|uniref:nitroreductase family protein n=1 Tax=Pseudomonas baetica TaxID=674054 RepID=UPI003EEC2733
MNWIKFPSPIPRESPEFYEPFAWPNGEHLFFAEPRGNVPPSSQLLSVFDVLTRRRSRRAFSSISPETLGSFLWHTAGTQASEPSGFGPTLEQRQTPSAGAIHPIHILIKLPVFEDWYRYDGQVHALVQVTGSSDALQPMLTQCLEVNESASAIRIALIAEPGKSAAKYHHAASLVWRDAGVLLGTMSIAAEAFGLHFCPLGITGEPWAGELCPSGRLSGVGIAMIGGPTTAEE